MNCLYRSSHSGNDLSPGVVTEGVTPVPIPNTEVKSLRADGSNWVTGCESRSMPGYISAFVPKELRRIFFGFFICYNQKS